MRKAAMTLGLLVLSIPPLTAQNNKTMYKTIFQFTVSDIYGEPFNFSELQGKKIMIVNTASRCGLTPQYETLQALYEKYKDKDFLIVGFPANNFLSQEPGSNDEISAFCKANYGVSFPMMEKISVKGNDMHPVYEFLTSEEENGLMNSKVTWNFQKYLIGADGALEKVIAPRTQPDDPKVIEWIEQND